MMTRLVAAALLSLSCGSAYAEVAQLNVAEQFGIAYLPLMVMEDKGLVEKYARSAGVDLKVRWLRFAGGGTMNDALISGSIDIAVGGVPSLVLMWDKAKGQLDVKGISAINSSPLFLNVQSTNVNGISDFTAKDKIAITSAKVSSQAIILQMAAAKAFGPENFDKLDRFTVTMRHPDAMAQLLSGNGNITGHFTSAPFQYQELEHPEIKRILSSKDIVGDATFIVTYATSKFYNSNPKIVDAFFRATQEAIALIDSDRSAAVELYLKLTNGKLADKALLVRILEDPEFSFGVTPTAIMKYASFMNQVKVIKSQPSSWRELFFDITRNLNGS
jgi:NitT/TauT family transport system substrate-binding protein